MQPTTILRSVSDITIEHRISAQSNAHKTAMSLRSVVKRWYRYLPRYFRATIKKITRNGEPSDESERVLSVKRIKKKND